MSDNRVYTIDMLIQKILDDDKQYDMSKIISAYEFAAKAHEGQKRDSGEPYIIHPIAVSFILLELGMDTDTICAAMLHDVVEDTDATLEDLRKRFGQDVAMLVDGVTKLDKIPVFNKQEQLAENIRKMLLAMVQDIRVIIIKLCDRLHNMRTLSYRTDDKQRNTALETMNIYAPIANRLGIRSVKEELEDLSFHYLDPYAYSDIEHILEISKDEREAFITSIKSRIAERFKNEKFVQPPQIDGRVKSIYSIYRKTFLNNKSIDEIYDKYAVRVIVSSIAECYNVLGIVHDLFRPIPNRFKDYISTPKSNMYQSLHTTVLGREGIPFEIQIRTWDMHYTAEYGIAAHWKYKEGISGSNKFEQRIAWARQAIEAQKTSDDVEEIVNIIKNDLTPEDIVVFTPKGDCITLPVGATIIDFAYRIHTQIGHRTMGAKVDGKMVSLDYKLQTGEIVEIITCKNTSRGPNRSWLDIAYTNDAKSKIRSWFKRERRDENIERGKAELLKEFQHNHMNVPENEMEFFLADDLKRHNCQTLDDFYASIGYGGIGLSKMMQRLKSEYDTQYGENRQTANLYEFSDTKKQKDNIIVDGTVHGCVVRYSQCCNPLPCDEIIGFITRGHGISVHKRNCVNYQASIKQNRDTERWISVQWPETIQSFFLATIEIIATDRIGLLEDVSSTISESKIPIHNSYSGMLKNGNAIVKTTVAISGKEQLSRLLERLKKVTDVISVSRI
jgi:GTP pyrophosphokinase